MVPPEQVYTVTQLATPTQADRLYLTLPLDLLGSPGTAVDILIRTASWGGGGSGILLPNDDLPNTTVVNFPVQPDLIPGDFTATTLWTAGIWSCGFKIPGYGACRPGSKFRGKPAATAFEVGLNKNINVSNQKRKRS